MGIYRDELARAISNWDNRSFKKKQETQYQKFLVQDYYRKNIPIIIANPRRWEVEKPAEDHSNVNGWYGIPVNERGNFYDYEEYHCNTVNLFNYEPIMFFADEDWGDFKRVSLKIEKYFVAAEALRMIEV